MQKIYPLLFLIAGVLSSLFLDAQLCSGSLGSPIINKTFGSGGNPGPPLSAASTNYQYIASDCPPDGFYTVRNNTTDCFGSTWHSLTADHTGDANGYFMLVNASVQPGAFYVDTVRGLCSGTTFEFAAWVINILKQTACGGNGNRPNLTFTIERIDGTVIQTYSTGDVPSQALPAWQQFGFFFTTPVGITDIVLRIVNNAPGGCGNDLALDDITFRPCGPLISLDVNGSPNANISICEGTTTSLNFSSTISSGYNNPVFQWQESINGSGYTDIPGATTVNYTKNIVAAVQGTYTYRLAAAEAGNFSNVGCRVYSSILTVRVEAKPTTSASGNTPICANNNLQLIATGGVQYDWNGPNSFTAMGNQVIINNAQQINSGKYYVTVSNAAGCSKLDSVTVIVNPSPLAGVSFSSITACEGDQVQLTATGGGTYEWWPATGLSSTTVSDPIASPSSTINYRVIVSNAFNCKDTAFSEVIVKRKPVANAGPDKETVMGFPVTLTGSVGGDDISYIWSPPLYLNSTTVEQPLVTAPEGMYSYRLSVVSNAGCGSAFDDVNVTVYKGIYIPTAFTPNNDGKNDSWRIPALSLYSDFQLSVFDRYGQMIFNTKNQQAGWNGTFKGLPQNAGVYVYMLTINQDGEKLFYKGVITLIR